MGHSILSIPRHHATVTDEKKYLGLGSNHSFRDLMRVGQVKGGRILTEARACLTGANAKHGLRCKACKMSLHHKCLDGLAPQRCMGKLVRAGARSEPRTPPHVPSSLPAVPW